MGCATSKAIEKESPAPKEKDIAPPAKKEAAAPVESAAPATPAVGTPAVVVEGVAVTVAGEDVASELVALATKQALADVFAAEYVASVMDNAFPKLRILFLHDMSLTTTLMQSHVAKIVDALEDVATFTFVQAPFDIEFYPDEFFPALPEGEHAKTWYTVARNEDGSVDHYNGLEESCAVLREADAAEEKANGAGFDCVWGFSQGETAECNARGYSVWSLALR